MVVVGGEVEVVVVVSGGVVVVVVLAKSLDSVVYTPKLLKRKVNRIRVLVLISQTPNQSATAVLEEQLFPTSTQQQLSASDRSSLAASLILSAGLVHVVSLSDKAELSHVRI